MGEFLSLASGAFVLLILSGGYCMLSGRRFSLPLTALLFLPAAALILLMDSLALSWPDHPESFPYAYFLLFVPAYLLFSDMLSKKLFVFLTQFLAGFITVCLSFFITKAVIPKMGALQDGVRLILLVILGGLYLFFLYRRRLRISSQMFSGLDGWAWVIYAAGPCLGCMVLPAFFRTTAVILPGYPVLLFLFLLWCVAVLLLAVLFTRIKAQFSHDLDMAREVLGACTIQADALQKMMESAHILRHDCKHHLHVAQILLETGKIEEARAYMLSFGTKCDEGVLPQFCNNPAVNALLYGYQNRCREKGIAFSALMDIPDDPPMDSFDLCTLLGNLLQNALEACEKAPEGRRMITLRGAPQGGQLLITVRNTFDGTVVRDEGHIISRKGEAGGLGIKSIKAIARRHRGEYVPAWDENTFTASVVLRL